jgi:hypothetical protein
LVYVDLRESAARRPEAWVILAIGVLLFEGKRPGDAGGPVFSDPAHTQKSRNVWAIL